MFRWLAINKSFCSWLFLLLLALLGGGGLTAESPGMLIGGYSTNESGVKVPCYWEDGRLVALISPEENGGVVYCIGRMTGDIYAGGFYYTSSGLEKPCYWKNGVLYDLPVSVALKNSEVRSVAFDGSDIFFTGYCGHPSYGTQACMWKNGELQTVNPIPLGNVCIAYSIAIHNGEVYLSGHLVRGTDYLFLPCYWRNKDHHSLPVRNPPFENGTADSMVVLGRDLYFAGYLNAFTDPSTPCYWKNDKVYTLPVLDLKQGGLASAIAVCGEDIVIAGFCRNRSGVAKPCYWRGNEINTLPVVQEGGEGWAKALGVRGTEFFITGYCRNSLGGTTPCYWKNGKRSDLPVINSGKESAALSICPK